MTQFERQNIKIQEEPSRKGEETNDKDRRTDEYWSVGGDMNQHELISSLSPHKNDRSSLAYESPNKGEE